MSGVRRMVAAGILVAVAPALAPFAQAQDAEPKAKLFSDKGRHHFPIATKSVEAQAYFDQGVTLLFNFNHAEAVRSFRRAAELEPKSPMPHWGIALALGPNYNRAIDPIDPPRNKAAYDAAQKAVALAADSPRRERAYANAIAKRYSLDPKADGTQLETEYMKAMGEVHRAFPDDLDAAVLYVEAIVNLRPWQLWSKDYKPAEGTEEAMRVLEDVMRRYPEHPGANHYYIHVVEASPFPERGLPSAERLVRAVPWAGHLVHMPCHIYIHTGDHALAARANELGIAADEEYFKDRLGDAGDRGALGTYRGMYYPHNMHFLAYSRGEEGDYEKAKEAADKLYAFVTPNLDHMPALEGFSIQPLFINLRFQRWEGVLRTPRPSPKRLVSRAFWHYGQALAHAARGRLDEAAKQREAFLGVKEEIPADAPYATNSAQKVLDVAAALLEGRLAKEPATQIEAYRKAVALEDALAYGEPPDWYYPTRESLGAALVRNGQAAAAEQVFREDLKKHRRNGRSLFGLVEALKAQSKTADAELLELEFKRAWGNGAGLRLEDY